ncbi:MAG: 50S ribosomal protein L1 [Chitinophagales bacterium]|jgi:large subunit ribosomal protein L1|nr:50S ribosomal protein L1 [Saprospirales bacterium]MBP6659119.1 50S ribosomal protein L1 [Chitinophagales bacterium]
MKVVKKRKAVDGKIEKGKLYSLEQATALVKEINTTKFDASVDVHVRLGVDPRKPDQALRGTVSLPHGTGKTKTVLVLCSAEKEKEAKDAGADYAGLDEYLEKIAGGWTDIDVIISTPSVMPKLGRLGKILGPRNLMPNPKSGTVTENVADAVKEVKKGKIAFKIDKFGIIHTSVGRVSFNSTQLYDNTKEMVSTLARLKPSSAKGIYFKSIFLATTMSPSIEVDVKSIPGI